MRGQLSSKLPWVLVSTDGQGVQSIEMWGDDSVADVDPRLLGLPVLILHGAADPIVPIERSRTLAGLLPDVEFVEFDGVGHVPTMTRPGEVVAAIQRRFA